MVGQLYQKQIAACCTQLQSYLGHHEFPVEDFWPVPTSCCEHANSRPEVAYARRPGQKALSPIGQNQIFAFVHGRGIYPGSRRATKHQNEGQQTRYRLK